MWVFGEHCQRTGSSSICRGLADLTLQRRTTSKGWRLVSQLMLPGHGLEKRPTFHRLLAFARRVNCCPESTQYIRKLLARTIRAKAKVNRLSSKRRVSCRARKERELLVASGLPCRVPLRPVFLEATRLHEGSDCCRHYTSTTFGTSVILMVEELDMESPVPWPSEVLQLPIACVGTARHRRGAEVKTGHPTSDPGLFEPAGMKLALP